MEKQSPEGKAYNRQRMQEVRTEVRQFVEKGSNPYGLNHLGELPTTFEDARRIIIALQDMLDTSRARHIKATKAMQATISLSAADTQTQNTVINNQHIEIVRRGELLNNIKAHSEELAKSMLKAEAAKQESNMQVNSLVTENEKLQRHIETLLSTIAIMNEGMV